MQAVSLRPRGGLHARPPADRAPEPRPDERHGSGAIVREAGAALTR